MIIDCINCSRKFNLNERLLKPMGSKVRCTRCGQVFLAFPTFSDGNERPLPTETGMITEEADNRQAKTFSIGQSVDRGVKVSVPASCISIDAGGNPLDFNMVRMPRK